MARAVIRVDSNALHRRRMRMGSISRERRSCARKLQRFKRPALPMNTDIISWWRALLRCRDRGRMLMVNTLPTRARMGPSGDSILGSPCLQLSSVSRKQIPSGAEGSADIALAAASGSTRSCILSEFGRPQRLSVLRIGCPQRCCGHKTPSLWSTHGKQSAALDNFAGQMRCTSPASGGRLIRNVLPLYCQVRRFDSLSTQGPAPMKTQIAWQAFIGVHDHFGTVGPNIPYICARVRQAYNA